MNQATAINIWPNLTQYHIVIGTKRYPSQKDQAKTEKQPAPSDQTKIACADTSTTDQPNKSSEQINNLDNTSSI